MASASDPYYYARDIQTMETQRKALGQSSDIGSQALTNIIATNFANQQAEEFNRKQIQLQESSLEESKRHSLVSEAQTTKAEQDATTLGAINIWSQQQAAAQAAKRQKSQSVGSMTAAGAAIGTEIMPGWGTAIGGVAGFVVGLFSSSVICTELNHQGYISDSMLRASTAYVRKTSIKNERMMGTYLGYRLFADPIVKVMQKSRLVTWIMLPYGKLICREYASRESSKFKSTFMSRMVAVLSEPFYYHLYRYSLRNNEKIQEAHYAR